MKRSVDSLENGLAVLALFTMALLPLLEAVVRTFYPSGISGSTIWVQHLALWVGFLGAAIAARRGELLSLTAGAQLASDKPKAWIDLVVGGISFAVCVVLVHGSLELVSVERDGGRELAYGLPVWVAQAVMPIGFALIGWRLLYRAASTWRGRALTASFALVPVLLYRFEALQETRVYLPLVLVLLAATALGAPIFVGIGGVAAVLLWHDLFPVSAIPHRDIQPRDQTDPPDDPAFHPRGLHSGRGRNTAEAHRALPRARGLASGRRRDCRHRGLRIFHELHRRQRRHHPRDGRALVPDAPRAKVHAEIHDWAF